MPCEYYLQYINIGVVEGSSEEIVYVNHGRSNILMLDVQMSSADRAILIKKEFSMKRDRFRLHDLV